MQGSEKKTGIKCKHAQKKGILKKHDMKLQLKFARKIRRKLTKSFWTEGVRFYLDGPSFTHETNPFDQVRALNAMAWRRPNQGLDFGFTAKGSHERTAENVAHSVAAAASRKGYFTF